MCRQGAAPLESLATLRTLKQELMAGMFEVVDARKFYFREGIFKIFCSLSSIFGILVFQALGGIGGKQGKRMYIR